MFQFDGWDSLWNLLVAITVRKCRRTIGELNAQKRDVRRECSRDIEDSDAGVKQTLASTDPTPDEAAMIEDLVANLVNHLDSEYRGVVVLRLQGDTVDEIAERINCSERTAYRVLREVRTYLQRIELET